MTVRAFFAVAQVNNIPSPYDTIHLKVLYPAKMSGNDLETNMGIVPADIKKAPFPVVIFFNGFNCDAQNYEWLAVKLAEGGLVVVLFNWVTENPPGMISLTPGVDIEKRKPANYRTASTAPALPAILNTLEQLQNHGILAGLLDLQRVILGGHSEGGRVACENAEPRFFPQVKAAFSYAAHNLGTVEFGYQPNTILPLPDSLPLLLMGGTCDGVIANSNYRYGISSPDAIAPITRTFHEALIGGRDDSYLLLIEGANHFSMVDNCDCTTTRVFLDFPATQPQAEIKVLMTEMISLFIDAHVRLLPEAYQKLAEFLNVPNSLIKCFERQ